MFRSRKGFTMVELLVVLLIIGVLAAVAVPLYLANTNRARASEAVATMSLIRQAERENFTARNAYITVLSPNLPNATTVAASGLNINVATAQYFSNAAYTVAVGGASARFTNPGPQDFVIAATGAAAVNVTCGAGVVGSCAVNGGDVINYRLEMDNSGRVFVSYDAGVNWAGW